MTDFPRERRPRAVDPVAAAIAFAIREAVARRHAERAERRRTMALVDGTKRGEAA